MEDTNSDKTKSNALFFSTHKSYADNINKIRYNQNVVINNSLNKNLRRLNKMNILPNKPEPEANKLNSEINFKVIGIILLIIFLLALIAFIIKIYTNKEQNPQEFYIIASYLNKNGPFINEDFNRTYNINYIIGNESSEIMDRKKVKLIINSSLTNLTNMFRGIDNLININLSNINSFFINDFSHSFENCSNLKEIDLTYFNTHNIKSMNSLFKGCSNLENITGLEIMDTFSVNNIEEMFDNCTSLAIVNLSSFNLDKIKNKNRIFNNNLSLKYVILSNSNNLNNTLYTIFNSCYFQDNNSKLSIIVNGHSKINTEWFDIINKEEDINITALKLKKI